MQLSMQRFLLLARFRASAGAGLHRRAAVLANAVGEQRARVSGRAVASPQPIDAVNATV
jgi:hypothetical protein